MKELKSKILLIDDDKDATKMLEMLLETRGYKVTVAHSGQQALGVADRSFDLIILDLVLPDMDGFEICKIFKETTRLKGLPIVVLSANADPKEMVKALRSGADAYFTKPFDFDVLVANMEAVLRRGPLFSHGQAASKKQDIIADLKKIIEEERIVPYFQPIYYLKEMTLIGVEALSRPKIESSLVDPEILFKAAVEYGFYHDLEILSWKKSIEEASKHLVDEKLFLNCNPYMVEGLKFQEVKSLFDKNYMDVRNVVLEITERSAVSDYKSFYAQLEYYRKHGFRFAVDDVGGGYASLESIVQTKPEVVKIDQHIIHQLETDTYKKSIVKFIVAFCKENDILSIAEGIESQEDLDTVLSLGVDAGQGYYLCEPTPEINLEKMRHPNVSSKFSM